jgi:hypothetical protein
MIQWTRPMVNKSTKAGHAVAKPPPVDWHPGTQFCGFSGVSGMPQALAFSMPADSGWAQGRVKKADLPAFSCCGAAKPLSV